MKLRNNIPNLITMLNLTCGSIAIIQVFSGEIVLASWLVIIAALFDFLDGFAARLLHAKSSIGAQLDSLADVVSFGLAPALIMFRLILESNLHEPVIFEEIPLLPYVSLLMAVAGAYRLARFNTDPGQSDEFKGLPIPANGLFAAALPLLIRYPFGFGSEMMINAVSKDYTLVILVILLSLLMVSRFRMFSLKFYNLKWKENAYRFILIVSLPVLVYFFGFAAIPLTIILYIILSGILNLARD
jgi:CDP-diacylglycerol--serine O-phosphatidyltransferase